MDIFEAVNAGDCDQIIQNSAQVNSLDKVQNHNAVSELRE